MITIITIITALGIIDAALLTWIYIEYKEKKELNDLIESIDEQLRDKYRLTIKNAEGHLNITHTKRVG